MIEKFKNCNDLIINLERKMEEYKLNESNAVNRLELIMYEIAINKIRLLSLVSLAFADS